MNGMIYDIEEQTIGLLVRALEGSIAMKTLFEEEGLSTDRDNWSAVEGLLEQALKRFRDGAAA